MSDSAASAPATHPIQKLIYTGNGWALFRLVIKNLLLSICTFGVYQFWAKTRLRRYLWANIRFMDEPFGYFGTGRELFISYIKFGILIGVPSILLTLLDDFVLKGTAFAVFGHAINIVMVIGFLILLIFVKFSGLRYRLRRTSWHGIRFELRGSVREYVDLQVRNYLLEIITLGLYKPMADVATFNYVVNKIHFGNTPLRYFGKVEELQKTYFLCWLLMIPTLGFSRFWYRAKCYAHLAKYTRFGNLEVRCSIPGQKLLLLAVTNALIFIFTLGLGYSYTVHRKMLFLTKYFKYSGDIDFAAIQQAQAGTGTGGGEIYFGVDDFGF